MIVEKSDNLIEVKPNCFFGNPQNKEFWNGLYNEWIDFSLEKAGFANISEIPILNKRAMVLLSGLLIMSNWMSSVQSSEQFHKISVNLAFAFGNDCIPDEIVRAAEAGACVGIICNTVSRAQHFAQMAREIKNTNVILYHAFLSNHLI